MFSAKVERSAPPLPPTSFHRWVMGSCCECNSEMNHSILLASVCSSFQTGEIPWLLSVSMCNALPPQPIHPENPVSLETWEEKPLTWISHLSHVFLFINKKYHHSNLNLSSFWSELSSSAAKAIFELLRRWHFFFYITGVYGQFMDKWHKGARKDYRSESRIICDLLFMRPPKEKENIMVGPAVSNLVPVHRAHPCYFFLPPRILLSLSVQIGQIIQFSSISNHFCPRYPAHLNERALWWMEEKEQR